MARAKARSADAGAEAMCRVHKLNLGTEEMNSRDRIAFNRYQQYFGIPFE
jgi:hypothetical protein